MKMPEEPAIVVSALYVLASLIMAANAVFCNFLGESFRPEIFSWSIGALIFAVFGFLLYWSNRPKKNITKWTR